MAINPLNKPFRIGVRPLTTDKWLVVDDRLSDYRAQKAVLFDRAIETVYATTEGMQASETEVLETVRHWLQQYSPQVSVDAHGQVFSSPLVEACSMINEDIAIMHRTSAGWILASACICFPSLWSVQDKIGRVLADVHEPVPGFNAGTRQANIIEQMFDKLRVGEPVVRFNYSIHDHDKLHLPDSRESCDLAIEKAMQGTNFIRSERQTLTCMPVSGDIVFTIDTSHRRVDDLSEQDKRVVESHLTSLSSKERQYKGFVEQAPMNKHQAD